MGNRLYVGNLNFDTTAAGLKKAFEQHGQVDDVYIPTDRSTGRSRGFGFVTMASDSEARKAMEEMEGAQLDGRSLRVNEAEPKPSGGGNRSGGGERRGGNDRGRGGGRGRDRGDRGRREFD